MAELGVAHFAVAKGTRDTNVQVILIAGIQNQVRIIQGQTIAPQGSRNGFQALALVAVAQAVHGKTQIHDLKGGTVREGARRGGQGGK